MSRREGTGQVPYTERVSIVGSAGADPAAAQARTQMGSASSVVGASAKSCPTCGTRYPGEYRACPHDGAALVEADELVGTLLGQTYQLVRILGEGGMGRVYEARHARIPGKRFAVKALHAELAREPEVLARFQREAEAAASIDDPHVVGVYDLGRTPDNRPYLVAEYLDGKELYEHLQGVGRLPIPIAVRIVRQICAAVAAAHAKGIVHRDLKPENVFLSGEIAKPIVKVIDFGISRLDDGSGRALTKTGVIMGTPAFMSPEQARGERVDHRTDVYSVGAILYATLTGARPFDRAEPSATLLAVLTEDPPRPRSLRPDLPESLELVIHRAMAKQPEERYATIGDLDAALATFDEDAALVAKPSIAPPSGTRPFVEQSRLVLLTGLACVGVGAGFATATASILRSGRSGAAFVLTGGEALTLFATIAVMLAMAVGGAAVYVRKSIWHDRRRVLEVIRTFQQPLLFGVAAYGFASLLVRIMEIIVLRAAIGTAWPVWDILLFLIGIVASLVTFLSPRIEARTARRPMTR